MKGPGSVVQNASLQQYKEIITGTTIASLIVITALYLPIFYVFLPLPILVYRSKLGRKSGSIIFGITILIMILIEGKLSLSTFFFMELLFTGFIMSEFFEKNLSVEKIVLYTTGIIIILGLAASQMSSYGITSLASDFIRNIPKIYKEMGVPEEEILIISQYMEKVLYYFIGSLPALFISYILLVVWFNLIMACRILQVKKLYCPDFGALNKWQTPDSLVWAVIAFGLCLLLPVKNLVIFGLNGIIVFTIIYFFQGIAIISFYFEQKQLSGIHKVCFYSLIVFMWQILIPMLAVLGLFDVWGDFRKLRIMKNEK
ncbi:YybS family protein [Candidatus Magnetomoraceae bacterium gMMP-15]